jgi:hypothetical protein
LSEQSELSERNMSEKEIESMKVELKVEQVEEN